MLTTVKEDINNNTIIVRDFSAPLIQKTDRSSRQKSNKKTQALNNILDQLGLTDTYRAFHPKTVDFTFFASAYGTYFRIDHILGHKQNLGKLKKLKIFQAPFLTTML